MHSQRMAEGIPPETGLQFLLQDSLVRKSIIEKKWKEIRDGEGGAEGENGASKRKGKESRKQKGKGAKTKNLKEGEGWGLSLNEVIHLVNTAEISNEMTHYAVVMDPKEGKVVWRRAYEVGELGEDSDSSSDGSSGE